MAGMALADGLPEALPGIRLLLLPVLLAGMLTPTFSLIQNPFSMAGPDFFTQSSFQQECWQGNGWVEIRKTIRREFDTSRIVEVDFAGVHLFMGRSQLTQPKILPVTDPSPSLNMHFMLRGKGTAQGLTGTPGSQFGGGQHNLTYRPGFEGRYRLEPGLVEQVNVQFDEVFFARLVEENCPLLSPLAEKMARRQAGQLASHPLPLTPALSSVLHQLQQSVPASPMRRLFLEAKVLELFALQVEQWEMGQPKRPSCWKGYDLDKLYAVKALLEENPLQAYSLLGLARQVGLNDFKLKKGFKELFGTSVFSYLSQLRLQHARHLLLEENKTVAEVAQELGYSQSQHFSFAFKKMFGYLPGQLKQ